MCQKYQPNLGMKSMGAFKVTEGVFHSNYSCRSKGRWLCSIAGRSGRCGDSNLGYMAQERTGPRNHSTKTYRARNADCTPCVICWRSIASTAGLWRVERECHRTPEDLKHAKWMQSGLFQVKVLFRITCDALTSTMYTWPREVTAQSTCRLMCNGHLKEIRKK